MKFTTQEIEQIRHEIGGTTEGALEAMNAVVAMVLSRIEPMRDEQDATEGDSRSRAVEAVFDLLSESE